MARVRIGLGECFHRAIVGSSNWPGSFLMFSATMTWNCRYIEGEREARVCFFLFSPLISLESNVSLFIDQQQGELICISFVNMYLLSNGHTYFFFFCIQLLEENLLIR